MLAHTEGREGSLLVGTQIRSLRMSGPLVGAFDAPAAGHPLCHFVPHFVGSRRLWPDLVGVTFEP
jgi:hypothetical protein